MASATNKGEHCKFGATCKRRKICRYIHPENEYDSNMFNGYKNRLHCGNIRWPTKYYDNTRFVNENQQSILPLPHLEYSIDQNFPFTHIPTSVFPNFHSQVYSNEVKSDNQEVNLYDMSYQYHQQSNESYKSNQSLRKQANNYSVSSSESELSNEINNSYARTTHSTHFHKINEEIQSIFRNNISETLKQHQSLIDEQQRLLEDIDDENDMKFQKEGALKELKDQLETFQQTIFNLLKIFPSTLEEAHAFSNKLKREIERLKARLPIYTRRQQLIDSIKSHRVIILKADTGSGKSSQLVQYLVDDADFADRGQIVCSQPRRLAARELAARVAKEFGCQIGDEIGCHVGACRPRISRRTRIRFVTDAVLLKEYQMDPMLSAYALVIIDEAHERHIDTDLLFGAMKLCLSKRSDIKASHFVLNSTIDL